MTEFYLMLLVSKVFFSDPLTELCLMFYLPVFTRTNLLLQRDSSGVHILYDIMKHLLGKLFGRFVTVAKFDAQAECLVFVYFGSRNN